MSACYYLAYLKYITGDVPRGWAVVGKHDSKSEKFDSTDMFLYSTSSASSEGQHCDVMLEMAR